MNDKLLNLNLSATGVIAGILWTGVLGCMVTMFALAADDVLHGLMFGVLGCALSAAAATVQIRGFFCKSSRDKRRAYEHGREDERTEQETARLHTV